MKIDRTHEKYNVATPEEGMWLFNGESFSDKVFAPKSYDIEAHWQEVSEAFKEEWEKEHPQPEPEE